MANYPSLPDYKFFWKSIQIEPVPNSGERITLGAIVQGYDKALIVAKFIPNSRLAGVFGKQYAQRLSEVFSMVVDSAESFYERGNINDNWMPPVDGFFVGERKESLSANIEEGVLIAAKQDSFVSLDMMQSKLASEPSAKSFNAQTWRKEIFKKIKVTREGLGEYFEKNVNLSGSGVPFKFGFISTKYAAHFEAVTINKSHRQESLIRAQSKLWQLDQLRDSHQLFHQDIYELVLYQPQGHDDSFVFDFTEELKSEASRRDIGIYTSSSAAKAARHIINHAA